MERDEAQRILNDFERRLFADKARFAVGRPGESYSGSWAFWGHKNEFYIGARSILGSTKISLHSSGICRLALTEQHVKLLIAQGLPLPPDRAFVKWRRSPTPPEGASFVVVLVFPTDYLRLAEPEATYKKPMVFLEPAGAGKALEVGFFYSRESAASLEPKFLAIGKPLFYTDLDNGDVVWMVVREVEFDATTLPSSEKFNSAGMRLLDREALTAAGERSNLNAILWNSPKDEEALRVIEIGGVKVMVNPPQEPTA
jgi:hypothetical protein